MGFVLKADASAGDAWVEFVLPSDLPEVWLTFRLSFDSAALAFWAGTESGIFGIVRGRS